VFCSMLVNGDRCCWWRSTELTLSRRTPPDPPPTDRTPPPKDGHQSITDRVWAQSRQKRNQKDNNKTHRSRNETEILARPPMRNVKQLVFTDGNTGGPPSNVQKWNETNDNRGRIVATLKIISADQRSHWLSKIKVSYFFLFFPSFIFPLNKKKILFR
jgi:hypothetical protein